MDLSPKILTDFLTQIISGEKSELKFQFTSDEDRETFRVALYKQKKALDDILLMTDETYKPQSLRFTKYSPFMVKVYLFIPKKVDFQLIE